MKAKRITALLMILTLTVALSACGRSNIELAQSGTESETENEVLKGTEEETEKETETETKETTEEVTEEVTEKVTEKVTEEVTEKVTTHQDVVQVETGSTPSNSGSSGSDSSEPAPNPINTHTHTWKEHIATQQVWVPNIVTVDDYEDKTTMIEYYKCYCGAVFDTPDELETHTKASMDAFRNGTAESFCGGFYIVPEYKTETVKVGSHEEDQGHYETSTYVDYYYCDCGAIK